MKRIVPFLISALFTLFILVVHLFSGITTMINGGEAGISNEALSETISLHKTHPVFIRRKITTWFVDWLSNNFDMDIAISFVLVSFLLLFLSGVLMFKLSKLFSTNINHNIYSLIGYYLCFPIMFMFFPPVYSYDEPLQFCLIIISLIFFFKKKYLEFSLAFAIGLVVRESGIIMLPALFFVFVYNWRISIFKNLTEKKLLIKSFSILLAILIYGGYLFFFVKNNTSNEASKAYFLQRLSYIKWNFQSVEFSVESIGSFVLVFALPLYFIFVNRNTAVIDSKTKKMIQAFFITLIVNTIIVYLNTKAREVRLFLIPMFFIWPIFGSLCYYEIQAILKLDNIKGLCLNMKKATIIIVATAINIYVSFVLYHPTAGPKIGVFNIYLFFSLNFILIHYILRTKSLKKSA